MASGASAERSVAAVVMLVIEDVVAVVWSPIWAPFVFFAMLVIVLSVRPSGLFGQVGGRARSDAAAGLTKLGGLAVALVALAVFPLVFTNPSVTTIAVFTLLFMASATAWNGFSGYSGYISLGHAAFFGTGAYVLAILAQALEHARWFFDVRPRAAGRSRRRGRRRPVRPHRPHGPGGTRSS